MVVKVEAVKEVVDGSGSLPEHWVVKMVVVELEVVGLVAVMVAKMEAVGWEVVEWEVVGLVAWCAPGHF